MKLIELLLTAVCAVAGIGALMAGNCLEALLLWLLPVGFFLFVRIRKARKEEADRRAKQQEESDKFWAKERELRTKSDADLYNRHRAAQLQQMNMMHQNASQVSAAQQQAAMQSRQGWADPRASYGSDLADNIVNLWAINSMLNQPSGVHASTVSQGGPAVTDTPRQAAVEKYLSSVQVEDSSSSSSSSYSSDTSSDSYGGSDTSSDSF